MNRSAVYLDMSRGQWAESSHGCFGTRLLEGKRPAAIAKREYEAIYWHGFEHKPKVIGNGAEQNFSEEVLGAVDVLVNGGPSRLYGDPSNIHGLNPCSNEATKSHRSNAKLRRG